MNSVILTKNLLLEATLACIGTDPLGQELARGATDEVWEHLSVITTKGPSMNTITIGKSDLSTVLMKWELDARSGRCMSSEESLKLSVKEAVDINASILWADLCNLATKEST